MQPDCSSKMLILPWSAAAIASSVLVKTPSFGAVIHKPDFMNPTIIMHVSVMFCSKSHGIVVLIDQYWS